MKHLLVLVLSVILFGSCATSIATDLVEEQGMQNERKAKNLLKIALVNQGWEDVAEKQVYKVVLNDKWQGLAKGSSMWGQAEADLELKYKINSFDGKARFLNGKRSGDVYGLQAWNSYYLTEDSVIEFREKLQKKEAFSLAATQYFMEIVPRLNEAQLVTFGGEKSIGDHSYDLIFATWNKLEAHHKNDQYILYLNQNTGLVDYVHYTVRDAAFPGNYISANIRFKDYKNVDGLKIPFQQYVYLGSPEKEKPLEKYLHRFQIKSFEFDCFEPNELAPSKEIGSSENSK